MLLGNEADVNAKNKYGWTPLHDAASRGGTEIAELLLQHGADVNAKDKEKWTALHKAARRGRTELVSCCWKTVRI